jgi:hypothetical protein
MLDVGAAAGKIEGSFCVLSCQIDSLMPNFDAASVRAKADEMVRADKSNVEGDGR